MATSTFNIPGFGSVSVDHGSPEAIPHIQFEDGRECNGLPRTRCEVEPLGHPLVPFANFIHESIHLFLAHRLGWGDGAVLARVAAGCDIDACEVRTAEASTEERLVLGFQVAYNKRVGLSRASLAVLFNMMSEPNLIEINTGRRVTRTLIESNSGAWYSKLVEVVAL